MKMVSIFRGQAMLELDEAGLAAGSDLDLIWKLAKITWTKLYRTCSF